MICTTYANKILNVLFRKTGATFTSPSALYLGLSSSKPNADGSNITEPSDQSYKRQLVSGTNDGTSVHVFNDANGGIVDNKLEIQMAAARNAWGILPYWFLSDSGNKNSSASTIIMYGELKGDIATTGVNAETVPVFYENSLKASIDVPLDASEPEEE